MARARKSPPGDLNQRTTITQRLASQMTMTSVAGAFSAARALLEPNTEAESSAVASIEVRIFVNMQNSISVDECWTSTPSAPWASAM